MDLKAKAKAERDAEKLRKEKIKDQLKLAMDGIHPKQGDNNIAAVMTLMPDLRYHCNLCQIEISNRASAMKHLLTKVHLKNFITKIIDE